MNRIGILGGTFDPIHMGHIQLAQVAKDTFNLDQILLIPSGNSYMKDNVSDASRRFAMTELAAMEFGFEISDIEYKRKKPSYTWETLQELHLREPHSKLYFIMGEDSIYNIEYWNHPEMIFSFATIIVASRSKDINSKKLRDRAEFIKQKYCAKIETMSFHNEISSTQIRESFRANKPYTKELPQSVLNYIIEHKMYI